MDPVSRSPSVLDQVYDGSSTLPERGAAPGLPFLASLIAVFSGAKIFALGSIREPTGPGVPR